MLCIGGAIFAGVLSVGVSFLNILAMPILMLYFLFLFLSATLGIFGFQEVFCSQSRKLNLITSMISLVILMVLLIITFGITFNSNSGMTSISIQFWIFYGLLSIVIPIFLTISSLISNNTEKWKSLMPLVIPSLFIFFSIMANSNSSKMAFFPLPIN